MPPNRVHELEQKIERLTDELRIAEEETVKQQRDIDELEAALRSADQEIDEITKPPWSVSQFIRLIDEGQRLIEVAGERIIRCLKKSRLDKTDINLADLRTGQKVWIGGNVLVHIQPQNENENRGEIWTFQSSGENESVIVSNQHARQTVAIGHSLATAALKKGDSVLVKSGIAIRKVDMEEESQKYFEAGKPKKRFSMVAGLDDEIKEIREGIIAPFLDPEGSKEFKLKVAIEEDFVLCAMLEGPPGCGKGLSAEATCTELLEKCAERFGQDFKVGFIMVRGPELLQGIVGNTENLMRELFLERTSEFDLSVIFWDEFGAMFPPRGMHTNAPWISTHVAQFNSMIGGFHAKKRKIILLAADNRIDQIDPAVIRDGRFNIKIHIPRPDEIGTKKILELYLTQDLPFHSSCFVGGRTPKDVVREMIDKLTKNLFDPESEANQLVEVKYEGEREILGFKDLIISGAVLDSLVERAKVAAYNRWQNSGKKPDEKGLMFEDLTKALKEKIEETDHLPTADKALSDWLKTEGIEGECIVKFLRKGKERRIGFFQSKS